MFILLDTNIFIHLKEIGKLDILIDYIKKSKNQLIISEEVLKEVQNTGIIKSKINLLIKQGLAETRCGDVNKLRVLFNTTGLGKGEIDIINIINSCPEDKFVNYLMVCEDKYASGTASEMGIQNKNFCEFMIDLIRFSVIDKFEYRTMINGLKETRIDNHTYCRCKEILQEYST